MSVETDLADWLGDGRISWLRAHTGGQLLNLYINRWPLSIDGAPVPRAALIFDEAPAPVETFGGGNTIDRLIMRVLVMAGGAVVDGERVSPTENTSNMARQVYEALNVITDQWFPSGEATQQDGDGTFVMRCQPTDYPHLNTIAIDRRLSGALVEDDSILSKTAEDVVYAARFDVWVQS